jgi:uncharacterized membrane protein
VEALTDVLEFLLGLRLDEVAAGRFVFGAPVNVGLIIGGVALVIAVVWVLYRQTTTAASGRLKTVLVWLKSAALAMLFLCLLRPMLMTSTLIPQEGYLGVIVDNSRSMTIRDTGGKRSRGELATALLYGKNGLIPRLQENFQMRLFQFDAETRLISGSEDLAFTGTSTRLAQSLKQVTKTLKGLPLSGLVVITDGGDNSREDPARGARVLKSLGVPVFTVGVGQSVIEKDREITQVTTARTVMEGSIFDVNITVRDRGYTNRDFELIIEEGGEVVGTKKVNNGKRATTARYTLQLSPEHEGLLMYTVRIPEERDELIPENNRRTFLVNNERKRAEILYIEGHPRNEYKFIRRAVEGDQTLRLATYLQTGPHKFLRQGIDAPEELANGYPQTKADLYRYEAIILGDISKNFFTANQLAMTRDFVSERGGGFLMIGGSTAFDEGFIASPIAEVLPVTLMRQEQLPPSLRSGTRKGEHPTGEKFALRLTAEGEQAAMLRMAFEDEMNRQLWGKMPQVQGINVTGRAKPGATVLAVHPALRYQDDPLPVIAHERFGRGRTMVITTASTWRWQMLMPHDDLSHERFWRQILRWLAAASPPPVELTLDRDSYSPGDEARVRVTVSDNTYTRLNDATVWLKITDPAGTIQDIRLEWAFEEAGIYTGTFRVQREGVYKLEVSSTSAAGELAEASTHFLVGASSMEYINAGMDADLLHRIADESGGNFYIDKHVDRLIDDLERLQKATKVDIAQDIWDMPLVLFLLFGLLAMEWLIRRRKGMS